jgi:hypothetical protein
MIQSASEAFKDKGIKYVKPIHGFIMGASNSAIGSTTPMNEMPMDHLHILKSMGQLMPNSTLNWQRDWSRAHGGRHSLRMRVIHHSQPKYRRRSVGNYLIGNRKTNVTSFFLQLIAYSLYLHTRTLRRPLASKYIPPTKHSRFV